MVGVFCPGIKKLGEQIVETVQRLPQEGLADGENGPKECALCIENDFRDWGEVYECVDRLSQCDDNKKR